MNNENNNENNKLVVIGQQDIQKGGIGFGSSRLFKLQPANLQLVQRMSRAEGAIAGKIRVKETGQHFDKMEVVLLFEPVERRAYYEGDDFAPENLTCFSVDMSQPHANAKIPQAMYCSSCPKASWDRYQQTKNKKDLPPCKAFWRTIIIDKETKLPYKIDFRGTSCRPFEQAMHNLTRIYALMQSQGKNPNIFDFSFTIYPVAQERGTYFTYGFKDFKPLEENEKAAFGSIYLDFINRNLEAEAEHQEIESKMQAAQSNEIVNQTIIDGDVSDGEYVII